MSFHATIFAPGYDIGRGPGADSRMLDIERVFHKHVYG